ncbi:hypothetical protein CLOHYLEM_05771 [[Clostridium] hylemonae DSM 15053]|uniref:Uncharacterized protein n=1 Tax=[Clostridium] hylemonae DSM 15053 TaxID=553973 RepID=C0C0V2_9FIRM|nr:hypothetical protein CLOHYLEM_05771 [[Clostridium] hylemonae DSM 15053]
MKLFRSAASAGKRACPRENCRRPAISYSIIKNSIAHQNANWNRRFSKKKVDAFCFSVHLA